MLHKGVLGIKSVYIINVTQALRSFGSKPTLLGMKKLEKLLVLGIEVVMRNFIKIILGTMLTGFYSVFASLKVGKWI